LRDLALFAPEMHAQRGDRQQIDDDDG